MTQRHVARGHVPCGTKQVDTCTWKSKCHIPIMHELSGGKIGMRNTWHGDCHVSSWIKKGVLHLDEKEFRGGRMKKGREKIERRERREKEKGRGKKVQHLLVSSVRTSKRFDGSGSKLDCAPRGRGSLIL